MNRDPSGRSDDEPALVAVDDSSVERTIRREPRYEGEPHYALLILDSVRVPSTVLPGPAVLRVELVSATKRAHPAALAVRLDDRRMRRG